MGQCHDNKYELIMANIDPGHSIGFQLIVRYRYKQGIRYVRVIRFERLRRRWLTVLPDSSFAYSFGFW
jgi:hypothetical protein